MQANAWSPHLCVSVFPLKCGYKCLRKNIISSSCKLLQTRFSLTSTRQSTSPIHAGTNATPASTQKWQLPGSQHHSWPSPLRAARNQGKARTQQQIREISPKKPSLGENCNASQDFGASPYHSLQGWSISLDPEVSLLWLKRLHWSTTDGAEAYRQISPPLDDFQECSGTELLYQYNWSY